MKRYTLEEIGKIAGVSRATVSRVINNHPNISDSVRQRVLEVIEETGYQPNIAARTLASNQSRILGLVIPAILSNVFTNPYYPRLIQGIAQACNEADYTMTLFLFQTPEEEDSFTRRIVRNSLLDGLIINADYVRSDLVDQLLRANMPFVQIGRPNTDVGIHYVDADNIGGGKLATQHLIKLGHNRIGQVATAKNAAGIDRDLGYKLALAEYGIPLDENLIVFADFSESQAYQVTQDLLKQRPTAIFVQSDWMAIGVIRAIQDAGLRIPEDIAIVSFDDLPIATRDKPHLSTIRQPITATGIGAVETLIRIIKNPSIEQQKVSLAVDLIIRDTCGAEKHTD
ncbi:MAG: LacI family DNA-binding transcriptional regulator [Phototrophicaceae bacterium]